MGVSAVGNHLHNNHYADDVFIAGRHYGWNSCWKCIDIDFNGITLINEISTIFNMYNITTEIIAASIRNPLHVSNCALAGADIATVPYKVIKQMIKHPLTDIGIEKFKNDWDKTFIK